MLEFWIQSINIFCIFSQKPLIICWENYCVLDLSASLKLSRLPASFLARLQFSYNFTFFHSVWWSSEPAYSEPVIVFHACESLCTSEWPANYLLRFLICCDFCWPPVYVKTLKLVSQTGGTHILFTLQMWSLCQACAQLEMQKWRRYHRPGMSVSCQLRESKI